ncbi:hypothetical protein TELCIR_04720 [Teladorsagia circumcincta]|uniref:Receptor ligand binding region domain-containing protein n=1 Tax=Teladorsagia circumcincta TaxID=45464 RepID=A0A2G9UT22_TELCI|nr:hypothetical protein TELCIR_04720 [Teladorsagia circumcincta]
MSEKIELSKWSNLLNKNLRKAILDVGLLCAYNDTGIARFVGWRETAGAVGVAWDKIQADGILPEYDTLNLTWVMSDCVESIDAGALINWVDSGADVVLGPPCSGSATISGSIAKYFDFPIVLWAPTFSSELLDANEYSTMMAPTWSSIKSVTSITKADTDITNYEKIYGAEPN